SPSFPPTSKRLTDPESPLYGRCTLRFWYCLSPQWKWTHFTWKVVGAGSREIWESTILKGDQIGSRCQWERAVVPIPIMKSQFSLMFSVHTDQKDATSTSFQMADVSIAAECFINDTSESSLPSVYNLWPCNVTGPHPPTIEQCQKFYSETDETAQLRIEKSGWMTWIAPERKEYRVELCGASGRSFEGRPGGEGGCVVAILELGYDEKLEVAIGQQGSTECNE
ncbi:hypothetical protein PFISCL1PPCAC_2567, partial [Pristionchus fissidentatus]